MNKKKIVKLTKRKNVDLNLQSTEKFPTAGYNFACIPQIMIPLNWLNACPSTKKIFITPLYYPLSCKACPSMGRVQSFTVWFRAYNERKFLGFQNPTKYRNIFVSNTPNANPLPSFDDFLTFIKNTHIGSFQSWQNVVDSQYFVLPSYSVENSTS